jgi:hypothetical protein
VESRTEEEGRSKKRACYRSLDHPTYSFFSSIFYLLDTVSCIITIYIFTTVQYQNAECTLPSVEAVV